MNIPQTPEEIVSLPVRELALAVLEQLLHAHEVNRTNFIRGKYATFPPQPGAPAGLRGRSPEHEPEAAWALAEAWDWLYVHGLISHDPVNERSFFLVTRRGQRVAADPSLLDEGW